MKVLAKIPPPIFFCVRKSTNKNKGDFLKLCVFGGAWERHHVANVRHSGDKQQ